MASPKVKKFRAKIVGALTALLTIGLGMGSIVPAYAAEPPITFTVSAIDLNTGWPVTEVEAGASFTYMGSVGCPDPAGCGPTTMTFEFPDEVRFDESGFVTPQGAEKTFTGAVNGKGGTLSVTWPNLGGTDIVYVPAKFDADLDASLNGSKHTAIASLAADEAKIDQEFTVDLRVYGVPLVAAQKVTWEGAPFEEGTRADGKLVMTARTDANAPSELSFILPNGATIPSNAIAVSEAFDLSKIELSQNPAGAEVYFTLADGTILPVQTLAAGQTTVDAPADVVGYTVRVAEIPSRATAPEAAKRTVTVTGHYKLRDKTRTDNARIVDPTTGKRAVYASIDVVDKVADAEPGKSATDLRTAQASTDVTALLPQVTSKVTWTTDSGDSTSVYESGEASTVNVEFANEGTPLLEQLLITIPTGNVNYFDYTDLTAVPNITFPKGATGAKIQYTYGAAGQGAIHDFAPNGTVPGPDMDLAEDGVTPRTLGEITGVRVVFTAATAGMDGGIKVGEPGAGKIELPGKLRNTLRSTGAAIEAPAANPGETNVRVNALIQAQSTTQTSTTYTSQNATLTLIKPQFDVSLSKRFGDGTDTTVYPLTGVASAGDFYDNTKPQDEQVFRDHKMKFVMQTKTSEQATETQGAKELVISDPSTAPTVANLKDTPFNVMKFTAIDPTPVVCRTPDAQGTVVPTTTTQTVWLLDELANPGSVTQVALADITAADFERVVGLNIRVTPANGAERLPVAVRCEAGDDTTVKFRLNRVNDKMMVSPSTIGAAETPGLLAQGNGATLGTGKNTKTATGADSLFLVDLVYATMYKHYAKDAKAYGVQGQNSPTGFVISAVPQGDNPVELRMQDFSSAVNGAKQGLDVFALTKVRDARVGPDQQMTIRFTDSAGAPIGPEGKVEASTELEGVQLTPEAIENSQNPDYLAFQKVEREITWDREWTDGEMAKVAGVDVRVKRADPAVELQEYGAASIVLDMQLRSHYLTDPSTEIVGNPSGVDYYNYAKTNTRSAGGTWSDERESRQKFKVFATTELFGNSVATWTDVNPTYRYLVAKNQTPSQLVLDASNRTAVGVANVDPENQWEATGSVGVGAESLTVTANGAAADGRNPFAITDFMGITEIRWPYRDGASAVSPTPADRVAAKITYTFADGTTETIDAPVGADIADLNPDESKWPDVVGVSATWHEAGKFIGIDRPNIANHARLAFRSDLLDYVHDGFDYEFEVGDPKTLVSGESIDGAMDNGDQTVPQKATFDSKVKLELTGVPSKEETVVSNRIGIDPETHSVSVAASVPTNQRIYRDLAGTQNARWSVEVLNQSNVSVSSLWLATDCELLSSAPDCATGPDRSLWPQGTPAGYQVKPGSAFDAFDVTAAYLSLPRGAVTATAWALGEDGKWTDAMEVTSVTPSPNGLTALTLPTTGDGPKAWGEVIGFRVQFDGDESKRQRIDRALNGDSGELVLDSQLRQTLRSDANEKAPATDLPTGKDGWEVPGSVAGTSHVGAKPGTGGPYAKADEFITVRAGTPSPKSEKFVNNPAVSTATSIVAYPGTWVDFHIRITNATGATSNLYDLAIVDEFPSQLRYNPSAPNYEARVVSAPSRPGFNTPKMDIADGRIKATWTNGEVLKPGESIVVKVPLMVTDGLPAGDRVSNKAYVQGTGIEGALSPGACVPSAGAPHSSCTSTATVTSLRTDRVRVESYLDASASGAEEPDGTVCKPAPADPAEFDPAVHCPSNWLQSPWEVLTTVGNTDTYRLKLINSGNIALTEMRFVNGLPFVGDQGVVLNSTRDSKWAPTLVPGSVSVVTGAELGGAGARSDAQIANGSFRYTSADKPCFLDPDAFGSMKTLDCAQGTWTADDSAAGGPVRAFGGDLTFPADKPLKGGEYVIIEFKVTVPATSNTNKLAFSSAALTGRQNNGSTWLPASESFQSGLRTKDTAMTLTKQLTADEVSKWHLKATGFDVELACVAPDGTALAPINVQFDGIPTLDGKVSKTITGLPIGGTCAVTDETYEPNATTAADQYGKRSTLDDAKTGFNYATDPQDPITLVPFESDDAQAPTPKENVIGVTNTFVESSLTVGVELAGDATHVIRPDDEFKVDVTCDFGDTTKKFDSLMIKAGETKQVEGLPVGANCSVTETDARGAEPVTAKYDGADTALDANRTAKVVTIEQGNHTVDFLNTFNAGGDLTVTKKIELPKSGLAAGDATLATSCVLGGHELELGDDASKTLSFGAGETEKAFTIKGIPTGAECTVSETDAGGANVPAPDRTVTILQQDEVFVEMLNVFTPATLEVTKELAGAGAKESRVPGKFDVRATCTRDLTVQGEQVTVTDHDAVLALTPGAPLSVTQLPAGSQCEVTEPYAYGAEKTTYASLTAGVENQAAETEAALVKLAEPDANDNVVPTQVEVTNSYKKTEGLVNTGGIALPIGAALALILVGLGVVIVRKRRAREA